MDHEPAFAGESADHPAARCRTHRDCPRSVVTALDATVLARLEAWPEERLGDLRWVATASDFVAKQAACDPAMLPDLAERGEPENPHAPGELRSQLQARLEDCAGEDEFGRRLRRSRTRQQLRIIWRDLTRRAALAETCRDLSILADACVDLACE